MNDLFIDHEWVRLDEEMNSNGERNAPRFARNVRSSGGSILGRVIRAPAGFAIERWSAGEFKHNGTYPTFDEAWIAMNKDNK